MNKRGDNGHWELYYEITPEIPKEVATQVSILTANAEEDTTVCAQMTRQLQNSISNF